MTKALDRSLSVALQQLQQAGILKAPERIVRGRIGSKVLLEGFDEPFIRANSNDYLQLSQHPALAAAAEAATTLYGVGPGAVRFIDGTHLPHVALEKAIASFMGYPSSCVFNSAYAANLSLIGCLHTPETYWLCDELNHNSLIRGLKMAGVQSDQKAIYKHLALEDLKAKINSIPSRFKRVCILTDGVFSMRGDVAPLNELQRIAEDYSSHFSEGVLLIVDDSHGVGAFGEEGKGTMALRPSSPSILVGTLGKAFGVNGGFVAGSQVLIDYLKQKGDTYVYTNPLGPAEAAAALAAVEILQKEEGKRRLTNLESLRQKFRKGLRLESIEGPHPIVPILTRENNKTQALVKHLFDRGVLATGLTYPVVPKDESCVRIQLHAEMSEEDIASMLEIIHAF
ncbi:MAG: aminotransferase class I/II-fold pyridoxal phosphate-dependent enzyme [Flavobacteriaceae bacterium]